MSPRRTGNTNYHFVWRRQIRYGDKLGFLPHFKGDPGAMRDLRAILEESSLGIHLARLTDDQVLAGISRLLGSGELMIAVGLPLHGGAATQADVSSQTDAPPAPAQASGGSTGQTSDPATFPQDLNSAAQAAVLSQAAASGAAVCPT